MKMSHDNDVTNCISPFHAKNKTKLLCLIRQGMVYDLDHTRQQCDWSYRYGLHQNQNWTVMSIG